MIKNSAQNYIKKKLLPLFIKNYYSRFLFLIQWEIFCNICSIGSCSSSSMSLTRYLETVFHCTLFLFWYQFHLILSSLYRHLFSWRILSINFYTVGWLCPTWCLNLLFQLSQILLVRCSPFNVDLYLLRLLRTFFPHFCFKYRITFHFSSNCHWCKKLELC